MQTVLCNQSDQGMNCHLLSLFATNQTNAAHADHYSVYWHRWACCLLVNHSTQAADTPSPRSPDRWRACTSVSPKTASASRASEPSVSRFSVSATGRTVSLQVQCKCHRQMQRFFNYLRRGPSAVSSCSSCVLARTSVILFVSFRDSSRVLSCLPGLLSSQSFHRQSASPEI